MRRNLITALAGAATAAVCVVSVAPAQAAPTTGAMSVKVLNVPKGAKAAVTVTSPSGVVRTFGVSTTMSNAAVGTWKVGADKLVSAGRTYHPTVSRSQVQVASGRTASVVVDYATLTYDK